MKISVSELRPNPFRDLKRNPLSDEKIDALRKSIKDTSFWDNVLVRKAPNGDDGYELAYGHNRLAALKKEHHEEIDVPVRKLSDTDMAKIMAHENMEEWGSSATVEAETIRAIVQGYADGRIELPKPAAKVTDRSLRQAPYFSAGYVGPTSSSHPYTPETLGEFLGWKPWRVQAALDVLAASEEGVLDEADTAGLTTKQAQAAATQARRVARETDDKTLAKSVGKRLASGMRTAAGRSTHDPRGKAGDGRKSVTIHNVRQAADEMVPPGKKKKVPSTEVKRPKQMPAIEDFVDKVAPKLGSLFPSPRWKERLEAVIKHAHWLPKGRGHSLVRSLRALAERANKYADRLETAMEVQS